MVVNSSSARSRVRPVLSKKVLMWNVRVSFLIAAVAISTLINLGAQATVQATVDRDAVARIRAEGLTRSEAPAMFATLVDEIGPRLTGSIEYRRAADWARERLQAMGMSNAR